MRRECCEYYPCHFEGQDCTFCFCPFYPCHNEKLGKMVGSNGSEGWDCSNCRLIHEEDVVRQVLELLLSGESTESVWKKVVEPRACWL
ncbi:MAG: cysteine-rich small domain-containing protein [Methermicoccaceae archaeon]